MITESRDTVTREDAKDVSLVIIKLRRGVAAKAENVLAEESLNACQGKVRKFGAIVKKHVNAL